MLEKATQPKTLNVKNDSLKYFNQLSKRGDNIPFTFNNPISKANFED